MADMQLPTEWPSKARVIAQATELGIGAARAHDLDGFGEAVKSLELHPEARDVHAHMIRELVETQYQDGVSGDDLSEVLTRTARDAGAWNAPVDPSAVVVVLTGSLAVVQRSDDDGPATDIPPARLNGAAVLVIADLAAGAALDHRPYLMRAVEEIRRAQTVEMP